MSDSESFIEEVNDEVRRDRLFGLLKRYGWIGGLAVVLIVGGAAWSEFRKAQSRAEAEALGDAMLMALSSDENGARMVALQDVSASNPTGNALVAMLAAGEAQRTGDLDIAAQQLDAVASDPEIAEIYRQIASFKSLTLQGDTMDSGMRRQGYEALAMAGSPLRLLAVEQLALMDVASGAKDAAIARYQSIIEDAAVTSDLQQRALQVIVALGGTPDLENLPITGN
ncbi:hypothetical protein ROLI_025070 [Roseobacter fucihabitans]|uniref:Tetratricopeptide repeat-like domain-containing protein n=1 Tax=Roseobacter fucihabitans TaxID=1537242 RepID=A0ABZ2BTY3_9RHOB|nr:hypothetical protein [Roseobacter litoralis]MBC6965189.1 hypothetical protein [Roseobacter litoralis]